MAIFIVIIMCYYTARGRENSRQKIRSYKTKKHYSYYQPPRTTNIPTITSDHLRFFQLYDHAIMIILRLCQLASYAIMRSRSF
jgi:hypothetical protein